MTGIRRAEEADADAAEALGRGPPIPVPAERVRQMRRYQQELIRAKLAPYLMRRGIPRDLMRDLEAAIEAAVLTDAFLAEAASAVEKEWPKELSSRPSG